MAPISFGILMVPYQIIDVAGPIDILTIIEPSTIKTLQTANLPEALAISPQDGVDIVFHHINETMDPVILTASLSVNPTTTCDDCPRLDYLIIGGPDPFTYELPDRFAAFLRTHVASGGGVFTTCTGAFTIASSGVLDGKKATTNHGFLASAKEKFPKVDWVKKQWVVDGAFWTAGGASAGMDMMAQWVTEKYGMEVAKVAFQGLDFEPRDVNGNRVMPQVHGV